MLFAALSACIEFPIQFPALSFPTGFNWTTLALPPIGRVQSDEVKAVVHLAARVHVMHDSSADPLAAFRGVNVAGTLNLARQAAARGVQRFLFMSSVKVNGECTQPGLALTEGMRRPRRMPMA